MKTRYNNTIGKAFPLCNETVELLQLQTADQNFWNPPDHPHASPLIIQATDQMSRLPLWIKPKHQNPSGRNLACNQWPLVLGHDQAKSMYLSVPFNNTINISMRCHKCLYFIYSAWWWAFVKATAVFISRSFFNPNPLPSHYVTILNCSL